MRIRQCRRRQSHHPRRAKAEAGAGVRTRPRGLGRYIKHVRHPWGGLMSGMARRRVASALAILSVSIVASTALAEEPAAYPSHPVRLLAASAPGGNPDVLARLLASRLAEIFGRPFVVENAPGVGGVIAAKQAAGATPDGYTLMINDSGGLAINVVMNAEVNYSVKDFTPITALATLPTVLVIKPSLPAHSLAEFIALVKSKPGAMSFGSAGAGSIHQLTMAMFAERAGINMVHVPYRGGTGLVNGLLTGEIDAGWSGVPNVLP